MEEVKKDEKVTENADIEQEIAKEFGKVDATYGGSDSTDPTNPAASPAVETAPAQKRRLPVFIADFVRRGFNFMVASGVSKDMDKDSKEKIHSLFEPVDERSKEAETTCHNVIASKFIDKKAPHLWNYLTIDGDEELTAAISALIAMNSSRVMDAMKVKNKGGSK